MFNWLNNFIANLAYDTAIYSAGLASSNGLHQMQEPKNLQQEAMTTKELTK